MSGFQAPGDFTLSEGVGKRLMTPGGAVAPGVAPELMPVLVLENDRPEQLHLSSGDRYAQTQTVAAGGAGTRSSSQLVNASADLLVVIERIEVTVGSGSVQLRLNRLGALVLPFGTVNFGVATDSRQLGSSQARMVSDNTLPAAGTFFYGNAVTAAVFDRPFVLSPGNSLYVCPAADNVAISTCTFWWRERRLNQSERL